MKLAQTALALAFVIMSAATGLADDHRAHYEMQGTYTDIYPHDVDYYTNSIALHRTKNTYPNHRLEFEVLQYRQECISWERVCTAYDNRGNCVRWETRCVQWDYRTTPVTKRIELNFRGLPALADGQEEVYQIDITRIRPSGDGEDSVNTYLKEETTMAPVKITRWSDYQYSIDPKN
jgi:hypothetical protein